MTFSLGSIESGIVVIEYNNSQKETKKINDDTKLQQIQSYCQVLGKNSLTLSDLQKTNQEENKPTNYLPYIIGGGIILILVIIIVYLLMRNKQKKQ